MSTSFIIFVLGYDFLGFCKQIFEQSQAVHFNLVSQSKFIMKKYY